MIGLPGGTSRDVVDEHHPLALEAIDDEPVVHDLVVAVDRRFEAPDHPGQRLDRHLDTGAEAPRLGEEHAIDSHRTSPMSRRRLAVRPRR